jgi:hypothetical protein
MVAQDGTNGCSIKGGVQMVQRVQMVFQPGRS